jgi:glycosyltransferase involved in cell wall biosynthesis
MTAGSNVSVVITCYREGDLIQEAIQSILHQTQLPAEIILVNDHSSDQATNAVCRALEAQPLIKVIWRDQNGGPSIARNTGFAAAQGDILVPLDADDLLPPTAIATIIATFEHHPDAGFIHGSYRRQDSPTQETLVPAQPITLQSMLKARPWSLSSNWTLIGTAPLRRWLWEAVGHSDPTLGVEDLHDLEFWIRAISLPSPYYATPEIIYIWRKYLGRNSRQVNPMAWSRIAQKHFDLYCQLGLDYRAYELLLLGSKWLQQGQDIQKYSTQLLQCILRGHFQVSSLIALLMPTPLFKPLATCAGKRR